jgi:DNA-binding NarL/FixJ family response regulator
VTPGSRDAAIIGPAHPLVERLAPLLEGAGFATHRASDAVGALDVLWNRPCELVVVNHPVTGLRLEDLLDTIRDRSSPSRSAGVVLLLPDEDIDLARRLMTRGINRLVPFSRAPERLLSAVGDLMDVSPRKPVRAVLQVESRQGDRASTSLLRTRDLSLTGMLVQGGHDLPVGTRFGFELHLPGEERAIVGSAQVVRHTDDSREAVQGVGVSFASFVGDGRASLAAYLNREAS